MKEKITNQPIVSFSPPDTKTNIITVYRNFPDTTTEVIGNIIPTHSSTEDSLNYLSTDLNGEELFPSSADFNAIEQRYISYAGEIAEKSFTETMLQKAELQKNRKDAIQSLRNLKYRKLQLFKSF